MAKRPFLVFQWGDPAAGRGGREGCASWGLFAPVPRVFSRVADRPRAAALGGEGGDPAAGAPRGQRAQGPFPPRRSGALPRPPSAAAATAGEGHGGGGGRSAAVRPPGAAAADGLGAAQRALAARVRSGPGRASGPGRESAGAGPGAARRPPEPGAQACPCLAASGSGTRRKR